MRALAVALLCSWVGTAGAGDRDLVLSRLAEISPDNSGVIVGNADFRALTGELAVILAPALGPADTLGAAGFVFSFDAAFTAVASDSAPWRVLESSRRPDIPMSEHGSAMMPSLRGQAKKGFGMPLPGSEISLGVVHVPSSSLWAAQGSVKIAIFEGTGSALPSMALRGGVSHLLANSQLGLTVGSADVSLSKEVGLADVVRVTPYGGFNTLFVKPRSELIDKTPEVDALAVPDDVRFQFKFTDTDLMMRHRLFAGAQLKYSLLAFSVQASFTLAGEGATSQAAVETGLALSF